MIWTTEKLNTFFAMKDQGYSLAEIAAELGCTYYAAQTQSKKRTKKKAELAKKMEDRVTEVTETNVSTEAPTETEAPIDTPTDHIAEPRIKVSRADILETAMAVVTGEREKQYGKPFHSVHIRDVNVSSWVDAGLDQVKGGVDNG